MLTDEILSVFRSLELRDVEVIIDRRQGLMHRVVCAAVWRGRQCIVKYSDNDPASIRNEFDVGRYFHAASGGLCPEMYSFVEFERGAACIMERMSGKTLALFDAEESSVAGDVDHLAHKLDALLKALKNAGVCHRDLGAANVMITESGEIRVFDFQNSAVASWKSDSLRHSLRTSRAFIYKYRLLDQPVIGLFNDKMRLLLSLRRGGKLYSELVGRWQNDVSQYDFYCPPGFYHGCRFLLRSVGVLALNLLASDQTKAGRKIRMKATVTWPTVRYWFRHGISGRHRFIGIRGGASLNICKTSK
jgi:serine/threonine protein kinase